MTLEEVPRSLKAPLIVLLMVLATGCASTQKTVGVGIPTRPSDASPVGISYTTTRQLALGSTRLTAGPTARYKLGPSALDLGFGLETSYALSPFGPGLRLGFDALNAGCTLTTCFGGTGGVHGGVFIPLVQRPKYDLFLDLTLDRDVRIGPVPTNTFLLSLRFHPSTLIQTP